MHFPRSLLVTFGLLALAPACHRSHSSGPGAEGLLRAASVPTLDPLHTTESAAYVASLGLLGDDYLLESGGWLFEDTEGGARLAGVVRRRSQPKHRFQIDLALSGRSLPGSADRPADSELDLRLVPTCYASNGGPIDPAEWTFYAEVAGRLIGLDALGGARLEVAERPGTFVQIGRGASNQCLDEGASTRVEWTVVAQPRSGETLAAGLGEIAFTASDRARAAVVSASADPVFGVDSPPALEIAGLGDDFRFVAGGEIVEHVDGTARLSGVVARASAPSERFLVDLVLDARVGPLGLGAPSPHEPVLELGAGAYLAQGGDADPATWHAYGAASGELLGLDAFAGAVLALEGGARATQVGIGANGRNLRYGARSELVATLVSQPVGALMLPATAPVALRFDLAPQGYARVLDAGPAALSLPGLGFDFRFVAGGSLVEGADGSARIGGVIARASDPDERFVLDLELGQRRDADQAGGWILPEKGLPAHCFVAAGGPVDTDLWHYYAAAEGRLLGLRTYAGARVELVLAGPALQVGLGANQIGLVHGASAALAAVVVAQPSAGPALPTTSALATLRLEIEGEHVACTATPVTAAGRTGFVLDLAAVGDDFVLDGVGAFVEHADGTATATGALVSASDPARRLALDLLLVGRVDPGAYGDVPATSPNLGFDAGWLDVNGGPVDPATWHYYTRIAGELAGAGALAGAEIKFWREDPAFQLGVGASRQSLAFGGSAPVFAAVVVQPASGPALPSDPFEGELALDVFDCE